MIGSPAGSQQMNLTAKNSLLTAPRAGLEPATRCLGGTSERSPDGAWHGLVCRLAAPIMAGRGPAWPHACRRWLPDWLPRISLAMLMFESSSTVTGHAGGTEPTVKQEKRSPRIVRISWGRMEVEGLDAG